MRMVAETGDSGGGTQQFESGHESFRARFVRRLLVYGLLATLLTVIDLAGVGDVTRKYFQDLVNRVAGPFYPSRGREAISVVLISDETIQEINQHWPVHYATHARILEAIRLYEPRAVMVDLLFVDDRGDRSVTALIREIKRYDEAGIPLYFAEPPLDSILKIQPLDLAKAIKDAKSVHLVPVPKLSGEASSKDRRDGVLRRYPAISPAPEGNRSTAAFRICRDIYDSDSRLPNCSEDKDGPWPTDDIALFWGTKIHQVNSRWWSCRNISNDPVKRLITAIWDSEALRQTCPYAATVSAENLLEWRDDPEIANLLYKRIVFYGADVIAATDEVVTPTHEVLPGVYMHAMALDNLISFKGRYLRYGPKIWGLYIFELGLGLATIWTVMCIVAFYLTYADEWERNSDADAKSLLWLARIGTMGIVVLIIGAVGYIATVAGNVAPEQWLNLLGLVAFIGLLGRYRFAEWLSDRMSEGFGRR